jgi:hypothetical protein
MCFSYLLANGALLCTDCQTCLPPARASQERHLRQPPHHIRGQQLQTLLDLFATYTLRRADQVALPRPRGAAIDGLRCHPAFTCCLCDSCLTRSRPAILAHVSKAHQQKPAKQVEGSSWQKCSVQSFFAEKQHIRYFVVEQTATSAASQASLSRCL